MIDVVSNDEVKREFIYSDRLCSGIVLNGSSKECLWEEEAGYPEDVRSTVGDPGSQEIDSGVAIFDPRSEWLKR